MAESYTNNFSGTTLNGAINNAVTSLTLTSGTNFPTANFRLLIDSEIMLVGSRSGTSCSSITRGVEGTTAASHSNGATVTHVLTAASLLAVPENATAYAAKGDILAATANDAAAVLTVGTNGQVIAANSGQSTGLLWSTPVTRPASVSFLCTAADTTFNPANGATVASPVTHNGRLQGWMDASNYTQFKFASLVTTDHDATTKMAVQCSTDLGVNWTYADTATAGSTSGEITVSGTGGTSTAPVWAVSSWLTIHATNRGDYLWRPVYTQTPTGSTAGGSAHIQVLFR